MSLNIYQKQKCYIKKENETEDLTGSLGWVGDLKIDIKTESIGLNKVSVSYALKWASLVSQPDKVIAIQSDFKGKTITNRNPKVNSTLKYWIRVPKCVIQPKCIHNVMIPNCEKYSEKLNIKFSS